MAPARSRSETAPFYVGFKTGSGTLDVNSGASFTVANEIRVSGTDETNATFTEALVS